MLTSGWKDSCPKNAALFAARILALEDKELKVKLSAYIKKMAKDVEKKQKNLTTL